jgi:hypothetical protein
MSALGHKRTCAAQKGMSALAPKADMCGATRDVRFVPEADMPVQRHTCLQTSNKLFPLCLFFYLDNLGVSALRGVRDCSRKPTNRARRSKRIFFFQARVFSNLIVGRWSEDLEDHTYLADQDNTPARSCLAATVGLNNVQPAVVCNWIIRVV